MTNPCPKAGSSLRLPANIPDRAIDARTSGRERDLVYKKVPACVASPLWPAGAERRQLSGRFGNSFLEEADAILS
jgi:hypothetical protein